MKRILILMESEKKDARAAVFIQKNLMEVLGRTVEAEISYLDSDFMEMCSQADLILVPTYDMIRRIHSLIDDKRDRILFASRTISALSLEKIRQIPEGETALVVNGSPDTTRDLIRLLYDLGIMHLNLTAYNLPADLSHVRYVITATRHLLPELREGVTVVNVGYRFLDTQAFLNIITRLDLENEAVTSNLLRYIRTLPPKCSDVDKWYLSSVLRNKTLQKVLEKNEFGVVVTDEKKEILYCNPKTEELFGSEFNPIGLFSIPGKPELSERFFREEFKHELIQFHNNYIMVDKYSFLNFGEVMGYFFEFKTAQSINEMGSRLNARLRKSGLYARYSFSDIIYSSEEMEACVKEAAKFASTEFPVLITGETGSGKELFAQAIHNASGRAACPFVAINCAALPEALLESELFGYEGGAFTGSKKEGKTGLLELANKGTVFLDEIGDMPVSLQVKLLRVLQEKQVVRVGSNKVIDIDIRIIAATNKSLKEEIEKKTFRADLYYRIAVFTLEIPPLRRRRADILPLFHTFTGTDAPMLTEEEQTLLSYDWPGNVRELRNEACYYTVVGALRTSLKEAKEAVKKENICTSETVKQAILSILREYQGMGIGRQRMLAHLRRRGLNVSESRFENLVKEMVAEGSVERGKGRAGMKVKE